MEPLSPQEEDLWRELVRLIIVMPRVMDEHLQREAGLSLTNYVVLMRLSEAPDRRLRMSDLAGQAELSPSRMSRIVQSLQAEGLVDRVGSAADGRSSQAVLTDVGLHRLQQAWPIHLASVRTLVLDQLDPAHLTEIGAVVRRIAEAAGLAGADRTCPSGPPAAA